MSAPANLHELRLALWTSNSYRRFCFEGRDSGSACEPITQNDGHPDLYFPGGFDGPVARRFLATWNACIGIPTETLTAISTGKAEHSLVVYQRICRERDALIDVARAAVAYDAAIQSCANDPDQMASYCTAEGYTLDSLYADWIDKASAAVAKYPPSGANDG